MSEKDPGKLVVRKLTKPDVPDFAVTTLDTPAPATSLDDILLEVEKLSLEALRALIKAIVSIAITKWL